MPRRGLSSCSGQRSDGALLQSRREGWGGGDILEYVRLYGRERFAGLILIDTPLYYTRAEWHDLAVEWARRHTPRARVVSFGRHLMFWEHPARFNATLDKFLDEVE